MHAALVAASACRDTAEREHFYASCSWGQRVLKPLPTCSRMLCRYQDGLAKKELDDAADRFERWSGAIAVSQSRCVFPQAGVPRS